MQRHRQSEYGNVHHSPSLFEKLLYSTLNKQLALQFTISKRFNCSTNPKPAAHNNQQRFCPVHLSQHTLRNGPHFANTEHLLLGACHKEVQSSAYSDDQRSALPLMGMFKKNLTKL